MHGAIGGCRRCEGHRGGLCDQPVGIVAFEQHLETIGNNVHEYVATRRSLSLLAAIACAEHYRYLLHCFTGRNSEIFADVSDGQCVGAGGYIFQAVLVGVRFLLVAGARPGSHNIFPVAGTAAQIGNHTYVGVHIGALRQPHEAFVS